VIVALRGMPARPFAIHTAREADGQCSSWVGTTIAGADARLGRIFVKQKFLGAVDYVQLSGTTAEGATVSERVNP
jgi:hypothetical protein